MTSKFMLSLALPSLCCIGLCSGQAVRRSGVPAPVPRELAPQEGRDLSLIELPGHVAPIVAHAQDLGRVSPNLPFEHLLLQLKRMPQREEALDQAIADLHDPKSASFHRWISAETFGKEYGATDAQLQQASDFLIANGLRMEGMNEGRTLLAFSGVAGDVEHAFHTEIHTLDVKGISHISNITEPSIPAALGGLIAGVSMSDFKPHPLVSGARSVQRNVAEKKLVPVGKAAPSYTFPHGNGRLEVVTPGDMATIYNLTPLWNQGFRGAGQTVAVVEDSFIKAADVATFRKAFGLSNYAGTFTQKMPPGALPCGNPGVSASSELEAALDAEWAGATAPDAAVVLAACADTRTEFGGLIATMNLLSQKTPPSTISLSYGECESSMGAIQVNEFTQIFKQAVAEGVTVFVSSGDDGSAGCDANQPFARFGLQVSGFTSTPYNVSVGGTDFYDTAAGTNTQYWSATNSVTFTSALSYIPEKTWNNSCADSTLLALEKYDVPYGPQGFCNNYPGYDYVTTGSGSGGPSALYSKPAWQTVAGVPADGARDIPDVSLFSANGFYGHALVFCDSDPKSFGVPCNFSDPSVAAMDIAGGTSFAAPAMAGIFTLITQKYGRQGNADIGLYALAAKQYGTQTAPISNLGCDSTRGNNVASSCTFYDVKQGNIALPCFLANCYGSDYNRGYLGALSTDQSKYAPAYPTTPAWDFATGLGTINATNLFNNWVKVATQKSAIVPVHAAPKRGVPIIGAPHVTRFEP